MQAKLKSALQLQDLLDATRILVPRARWLSGTSRVSTFMVYGDLSYHYTPLHIYSCSYSYCFLSKWCSI
jgi:hypothetical protein